MEESWELSVILHVRSNYVQGYIHPPVGDPDSSSVCGRDRPMSHEQVTDLLQQEGHPLGDVIELLTIREERRSPDFLAEASLVGFVSFLDIAFILTRDDETQKPLKFSRKGLEWRLSLLTRCRYDP